MSCAIAAYDAILVVDPPLAGGYPARPTQSAPPILVAGRIGAPTAKSIGDASPAASPGEVGRRSAIATSDARTLPTKPSDPSDPFDSLDPPDRRARTSAGAPQEEQMLSPSPSSSRKATTVAS